MVWERALFRWWAANARKLGLPTSVLAVVGVIVTRMGEDGLAWPSRHRVMADAGIADPRTFARALRVATAHGLLTVRRRRRKSALYQLGDALQEMARIATSAGREVASTATSRADDVAVNATSSTEDVALDAAQDVASYAAGNDVKGNENTDESPPPRTSGGSDARADQTQADYESWATFWNRVAAEAGLPRVLPAGKWPARRRAALLARLREHGASAVEKVLRAPLESRFLRGEAGREGWRGATLDWLLRPSVFVKVLEGAYTDRKPRSTAGPPPSWPCAARPDDWGVQ